MFVVPRSGALALTAHALLAAALLLAPGAIEGLAQHPAATISAQAEAARDAGRLDEAVALYRKALALRATWQEGWWALGTILYEQDAHSDAARAFRRLLALDPKNGTAHLMLALCEYQLNADASALANIQIAKKLGVQADRGLPQVMTYHEGMLFLRAGQYERALDTLKPLASAGVEDEHLELALGMSVLLMPVKDTPAAGSSARAIVMRAGRAERHFMATEFPAAKREYTALVQEAPAFPNVHYAYGRFLLATESPDAGIQEFLKEIEAQRDHIRARVQIAAARHRLDSSAGLPFAIEVVGLAPDYPFGHYLLGLLYFDLGDITNAIPELETAARMRPNEAQFQFALGNAYARAGRTEEAARARAAFTRLKKSEASVTSGGVLQPVDLDTTSRPSSKPSKPSTPSQPTKPGARKPIRN